jgi:hypothetical protein
VFSPRSASASSLLYRNHRRHSRRSAGGRQHRWLGSAPSGHPSRRQRDPLRHLSTTCVSPCVSSETHQRQCPASETVRHRPRLPIPAEIAQIRAPLPIPAEIAQIRAPFSSTGCGSTTAHLMPRPSSRRPLADRPSSTTPTVRRRRRRRGRGCWRHLPRSARPSSPSAGR